jgi:hypothetical protein
VKHKLPPRGINWYVDIFLLFGPAGWVVDGIIPPGKFLFVDCDQSWLRSLIVEVEAIDLT